MASKLVSTLGGNATVWNALTHAHVGLYQLTGGRIGGRFRGVPCLLLHHVGRKSGKERVTPLMYAEDGDDLVIVASKGGAPHDPVWWLNLKAHPDTTVQVGGERREVRAERVSSEEKKRLWPHVTSVWPDFDDYQRRTERDIPVIRLERR
jgi:deazaflavin-dependent oxidoreductase (nitroreductase family)